MRKTYKDRSEREENNEDSLAQVCVLGQRQESYKNVWENY